MKNTKVLIPNFFKNKLIPRIGKIVLIFFLLLGSTSIIAQNSRVPWLEGSWGVRLIMQAGSGLDNVVNQNYDYVEYASQINQNYPTAGHVITNFNGNANGTLFTLRQNANVDIAAEIDSTMVPSLANEQIIFDVINELKSGGKRVLLYMNFTPNMSKATDSQRANWDAYVNANFGGSYITAYNDLIKGFVDRYKGLIDGYWIDNFAYGTNEEKDSFIQMMRATDPNIVLCANFRKSYFTDIEVDSDGLNDSNETDYRVIKFQANDIWSDFTGGHVTPIGQGAPSNSWGYEEFTVTDMVADNISSTTIGGVSNDNVLKHMFTPIRERWTSPALPLLYDKEQAYRVIKRITDAGGAITFSTTTSRTGTPMPDEVEVLTYVNEQLEANGAYVPYVRPAGAFLVGETAPDYNQFIDFPEISDKDVNEADFSPATASSGDPVTYVSSDTTVATIVNNQIRLQGAGTTNITASQGGNDTFAAAPDVTRPLTVTGEDINFALSGTATQSKTLFGAEASRAIDGNTNGNFRKRSVSVAKGPYAWWEVDLGDTYRVTDIVVFKPTNRWCRGKFSDFTVSVINESGVTTYSERITGIEDPSVSIDAQGALGQTIRVQSHLFWFPLILAEVQVFGKEFFKLDQTITFPTIPEKEIGDADFDPGATATSGYSVSYTSSNTDVATIVDGNIRIIGAGTSEITASQDGDDFYNPAVDVIQVLNVARTNFALNGTATQSTTIGAAVASRAIDGNTDGIFSRGSVSAAQGPEAWWQVELADSYSVTEINVFNRTNCCEERLADFTVYVIDSSANITYEQTITTIPEPSVSIDAGGAIGNVVRVESNITLTMNLAEVQVFGNLLTSETETSSREVSELVEKEELTERLVNNHLLVYPNPTSHMLNIEFKGDETTTRVEILNHKGQMMHTMNIHDSNSATVDISGLSRGLYIIKVSNQYEVLTRKILKE